MADRENVIKGLSELEEFLFSEYRRVSADEAKVCYERFVAVSNALELLKEKQPMLIDEINSSTGGDEMDKESVMQALQDSLRNQHCGFIEGVGNVYAVSEETINKTLELLKEQETELCDRCGRRRLKSNIEGR